MELANRVPAVTLVTTMGNIELELYWQHAPKTVYNFVELARKGSAGCLASPTAKLGARRIIGCLAAVCQRGENLKQLRE